MVRIIWLDLCEINDTTCRHQALVVLNALKEHFRSALYIDYVVSEEFN